MLLSTRLYELSYIQQRHEENTVKSQVEDKSCENLNGGLRLLSLLHLM
jgi:hypothetical protein